VGDVYQKLKISRHQHFRCLEVQQRCCGRPKLHYYGRYASNFSCVHQEWSCDKVPSKAEVIKAYTTGVCLPASVSLVSKEPTSMEKVVACSCTVIINF
jgi:hypothetical protein